MGYVSSKVTAGARATGRVEAKTLGGNELEVISRSRGDDSLTGRAVQLPQWEVDESRSVQAPEQHAGSVPVH